MLKRELAGGTAKRTFFGRFSLLDILSYAIPENIFVSELLEPVHNETPLLLPHASRVGDDLRILPVDQLSQRFDSSGWRH